MLWWLPRRRARIEDIESEAEAMIGEFGPAAYLEARRKGHQASSATMAKDWTRVAIAILQKTGRGAIGSTAQQMRTNATRELYADEGLRPARQRRKIQLARPCAFRIQYASSTPNGGSEILKELEIKAVDVPAAIVAAAQLALPPKTTSLRILDHQGREVFERQRAGR
jgi:hypothetical protein